MAHDIRYRACPLGRHHASAVRASPVGPAARPCGREPHANFLSRRGFGHLAGFRRRTPQRSEEHTSELQSLMRNSYAVFCLKKKKQKTKRETSTIQHYTYNIIQFVRS